MEKETALEILRELHDNGLFSVRTALETLIPELAESEDEKMLREIKKYIKEQSDKPTGLPNGTVSVSDMIAWFEKQGEQKLTDEVEPKFKQGEWIVWKDKCYKVNYNGCGYELVDQDGLSTSLEYGTIDENAHLWTIEDAKDGDVLCKDSTPFIFKCWANNCIAYCGITSFGLFKVVEDDFSWCNGFNVTPATKEERDTLFTRMKEEGYEWSDKDRKLIKIQGQPNYCKENCKGFQEIGKCLCDGECKDKIENDLKKKTQEKFG